MYLTDFHSPIAINVSVILQEQLEQVDVIESWSALVTLCEPCEQGSRLGRPYNQQGKLQVEITGVVSMQML